MQTPPGRTRIEGSTSWGRVMENHYRVLNVGRDATEAELRQAYRDAVRRCHPDLHPADRHARQKFLQVQAAFEVLSNPEKRRAYDPDKAVARPPRTGPLRTGRAKRRRQTYRAPCKEEIVFQRVAWCARARRACWPTVTEESRLKSVRIWTFASMVLGYLGIVLLFSARVPF